MSEDETVPDDNVADDMDDDRMTDDLGDVEALLAELDVDDVVAVDVPPSVWAGIEAELEASPVIEMPSRRRRAAVWISAVAAAVVIAVGAVVIVNSGGDDVDVLSTAELSFDPETFDPLGATAAAEAQLVSVDGQLQIRLVDTTLPQLDGEDLELWLIEPDAAGNPVDVAPVAVLTGSDRYAVPAGLDPTSHFVVDISVEPRDGDAAHSGRSILRGPFETT